MISSYLGILITIFSYLVGKYLSKKFKNPIFNPLLVGIVLSILIMVIFDINYDEYKVGGDYISFFIAPATVALVVPLYKNISILRRNLIPIVIGIFVGSLTAVISVIVLADLLNLDYNMKITLMTQSITTAIALPMSEILGGIGAITAIAVSSRGVFGAVIAPSLFKLLKIEDPVAKGVSIGTASHASGTSKAIEMGEVEGSISGLSIAIAGVFTAIIIPIFISIM